MLVMAATTAIFTTSCENDNINPYDYANNGNNQENQGSTDAFKTDLAEYPKGSLVWTKDTTLSESVEIPVGTSLYIEPGVTITCKSEVQVPVEIVVLGNITTRHILQEDRALSSTTSSQIVAMLPMAARLST